MKRLCFLACLAATVVLANEPADDRIRGLVKQLGADTFKQREAAQKELSAMPRHVLPILREFENTKDPEIKDRLQAAIHAILTDMSRVPHKVHVYCNPPPASTVAARNAWMEEFAKWQQKTTITLCQTNGRSSISGNFGQSFVPHTQQIRAIAVQAYPFSTTKGWLSLDLRTDKEGRPDSSILARSWLRMENRCAPSSSFAVFPLPDLALEKNKPHWFTITEHSDSGQPLRITHRYESNTNNPELQMLRNNGMPGGCANFFLLAECPLPPWLREATEDERKLVPTLPALTFEWWNRGDIDSFSRENDK